MAADFYLWEHLKETKKSIVIYGMGDGCDKILGICREKEIPIRGIFASDEYVRDKTVHGFPLKSYKQIREELGDVIVLLAFGVFRPDLMERILQMNKEVELYAPEVPLFGGGLFDRTYDLTHKREWEAVKAMLSDEASKEVFQSLLEYRRTGRILPLVRSESDKSEDLLTLVPFREGDVYVDLGAYDGDTVAEWARLHPNYGSILAVEPGKKTFEKLKRNTCHMRSVQLVEGAIWNENAPLSFNGKSGRSAAVSSNGRDTVAGYTLDGLCKKADFIKFDVEGAEKEAIEGAAGLIQGSAPTLCISCYHRTEDLFAIPLQVKRLVPEYRVYLRHQPYVPAWDTVFYFVKREG